MSRNFELLRQIELEPELGATEHRSRVAPAAKAFKSVAPTPMGDSCGEEISRLVHGIFLTSDENAPRQVVFCGVDGASGSSSVCASVGRTLAAKSLESVCLVDANPGSTHVSDFFGVDTTNPLSLRSSSIRGRSIQITVNLWLAGKELVADGRGALRSMDELKHIFEQLRAEFDYVLIVAPGANVCGDAAIIGQVADAVVLVIEANSTRRMAARKAKDSLEAAGIRLLGTVLHNRRFPIPERLYRNL